jgi:hypothetical protein
MKRGFRESCKINAFGRPMSLPVIKITKISAAKRQLIEAIKLFFEERDPVSIHTLVGAASGILNDHFDRKDILNHKPLLNYNSVYIEDEDRKTVSDKIREHQNFFKHADLDLKEGKTEIEFNIEKNPLYLFEAIRYLKAIEKEKFILEPEFRMFWIWFSLKYPDCLKGKLVENPEMFDPNNLKFFSETCSELRNIFINDPSKYPNDCKNAFVLAPKTAATSMETF